MKIGYKLIENPEDLRKYVEQVDLSLSVVADTESTSLDILTATLLGFSFYQFQNSYDKLLPVFVLLQTPYFNGRGISLKEAKEILNPLFASADVIMHNAKYDTGVFEQNGFTIPNVIADTVSLIHSADPELKKNLEERVYLDFGYKKKKFADIIGITWNKIKWTAKTYEQFAVESLAGYSAEDAFWTWRLYVKYVALCEKREVIKIHDKIELPLTHVLRDMKKDGIRIDLDTLHKLEVPCLEGITRLQENVYKETGFTFNLNSPKQKAEIFYDKLHYHCPSKTKTGQRATDKFALEHLAYVQKCKAAEYMIEHSQLNKLYTGYIVAIPKMVDDDGRLRCDFNSLGTVTGRFSSSDPNLQNQPVRGAAKEYPVRSAFIAAPGSRLLVLDYSQIELRVAAHLSKDARMIKAFMDGRDIHQEVADQLDIERRAAKDVNFGIFYGLGAKSLASRIGVSEREAQKFIDDYYATYVDVTRWKKHVEQKTKHNGYVRNMFGRLRVLPDVNSTNKKAYFAALRQAVNTAIQGTAADMIKLAMINVHRYIKENKLPAKLLLTVHDELVIEARNDIAVSLFFKVKKIMESVVEMRVPIIAEGKVCDNWQQSKDDSYKGYQHGGVISIEPYFHSLINIA